jgi:hypothetical protein
MILTQAPKPFLILLFGFLTDAGPPTGAGVRAWPVNADRGAIGAAGKGDAGIALFLSCSVKSSRQEPSNNYQVRLGHDQQLLASKIRSFQMVHDWLADGGQDLELLLAVWAKLSCSLTKEVAAGGDTRSGCTTRSDRNHIKATLDLNTQHIPSLASGTNNLQGPQTATYPRQNPLPGASHHSEVAQGDSFWHTGTHFHYSSSRCTRYKIGQQCTSKIGPFQSWHLQGYLSKLQGH